MPEERDELVDSGFKMKVGRSQRLLRRAGCIIKILVTIGGDVDPERVQQALPQLKKRHPLLGSKMILDREGQAWLVTERVPDFELQVYEKRGDTDWLERISEQDLVPFRMNVGPLVRFILLTSESSSDLILYMHHVMSDGLSALYVMEDLLSLIGEPGKELPPLPLPVDVVKNIPPNVGRHTPGIERSVMGRMNARWRKNKVTFSDDDFVKLQEKRYEERDRAILLSLTVAETSALTEKCHMKGVTVNSVLLTALLTAKYAVPGLAEVIPDKLRVVVNLRDKLTEDPGRGCGYYAAGVVPLHARFNSKKDFEHNLLTIHSEAVRKIRDDKELFKDLISTEMVDPDLLDALDFESYGMLENQVTKRFQEMMAKMSGGVALTNLGRQDFPEQFGDLKVRKVIFLAPTPLFKVLLASVLTACGCLQAAFLYRESSFSTQVMKEYVNAVERSLRDFMAIDSQ